MSDEDRRAERLAVFGANVALHRRKQGLTQAQLAERVGLDPRMIRAIEAGRTAPSFGSIVVLADALGVAEGELFEDVEVGSERRPGRPRRDRG